MGCASDVWSRYCVWPSSLCSLNWTWRIVLEDQYNASNTTQGFQTMHRCWRNPKQVWQKEETLNSKWQEVLGPKKGGTLQTISKHKIKRSEKAHEEINWAARKSTRADKHIYSEDRDNRHFQHYKEKFKEVQQGRETRERQKRKLLTLDDQHEMSILRNWKKGSVPKKSHQRYHQFTGTCPLTVKSQQRKIHRKPTNISRPVMQQGLIKSLQKHLK